MAYLKVVHQAERLGDSSEIVAIGVGYSQRSVAGYLFSNQLLNGHRRATVDVLEEHDIIDLLVKVR